jgi:hypothetical protein
MFDTSCAVKIMTKVTREPVKVKDQLWEHVVHAHNNEAADEAEAVQIQAGRRGEPGRPTHDARCPLHYGESVALCQVSKSQSHP